MNSPHPLPAPAPSAGKQSDKLSGPDGTLALLLRSYGLDKHQLAARCAQAGSPVAANTIESILRGRANPRLSTLQSLSHALGFTITIEN